MNKGSDAMKITILGSGGYLRIPRACCPCNVCGEARKKGVPYERLGQSMFIDDESILFDTPEDINTELNRQGVKEVKHIFYSHWHPDHTKGVRIIETIKNTMDNVTPGDVESRPIKDPIQVYVPEKDFDVFKEKNPHLFYFEQCGFCKVNVMKKNEEVSIGKIRIKPIDLDNSFAFGYMITEGSKKIAFVPCHAEKLKAKEELDGLDLLIMNLGFFTTDVKDYKKIPEGHQELRETGFEKDNLRLIRELKPRKTVLTHIEEKWSRSYADYCRLEKEHKKDNLKFSYDGMKIKV